MSSIPPEALEVIQQVVGLTREGRLDWDTTTSVPGEGDGVYVSLASGELELSRRLAKASNSILINIASGGPGRVIDIKIRNENGVPIYSFLVDSADSLFKELNEAYELAWQQALGAPETLNKIREELAARAG